MVGEVAWSGRLGVAVPVLLLATAASSCTRNPATGRLQFGLVSEDDEVALGREADEDVRTALGVYEDDGLAELVTRVGSGLAAQSERPDLPWTFVVLDEPAVNAFALPGGWVYVTRGLLAHLISEDELAAVLGHEAGHVTARHGVVQLRKQRSAQRSVGLFRIVDPNLQHIGGIAARTAGLALLKHSRDDEYQADDLGLRYVVKGGYDAHAITAMFTILAGVSAAEGGEEVPPWLSTHPEPELRRDRMAQRIADSGIGKPEAGAQPDAEFLAKLDGMVFGDDPRAGFFAGATFIHPNRGFQIDLPEGWRAQHNDDRVFAATEDDRSVLAMGPSEAESAAAALEEFFADGKMTKGELWSGEVSGMHVESSAFSIGSGTEALAGLVAFVDFEDGVIAILAIGDSEIWNERLDAVATTFASLSKIRAKEFRNVEPMRVSLMTLSAEQTIEQVHAASASVVDVETLALINHAALGHPMAVGRVVKVVRGFNPASLAEAVEAVDAAPPPP
ncbi:MAG: M48 family metalloprotease [Myxococcota bacterium]